MAVRPIRRRWELLGAAGDRRRIWRDPVDPMVAVACFDPKYIHAARPEGMRQQVADCSAASNSADYRDTSRTKVRTSTRPVARARAVKPRRSSQGATAPTTRPLSPTYAVAASAWRNLATQRKSGVDVLGEAFVVSVNGVVAQFRHIDPKRIVADERVLERRLETRARRRADGVFPSRKALSIFQHSSKAISNR